MLLIGVAAAAWLVFAPGADQAPSPIPVLDPRAQQEAERRAAAILARHQQLSAALSGFGPLALGRASIRADRDLQRSAAFWRLIRKGCDGGGCTLGWQALAKSAGPAGLAAALGLGRDRIGHDLVAEQVSVTVPLGATPERIEAGDTTIPAGRLPPLVDRCRRFQGLGGACTLGAAQPAAIPNAELLPPQLRFQVGKLTLAGPLGRADTLLAVFGDPTLSWIRADRFDLDFDRLTFSLEGHYVIP
jgi:hypothetical protein